MCKMYIQDCPYNHFFFAKLQSNEKAVYIQTFLEISLEVTSFLRKVTISPSGLLQYFEKVKRIRVD